MKEKTIVIKNKQESESVREGIKAVCLDCAVYALCNPQIEVTPDMYIVVQGQNGFLNTNICGI